MWEAFEDFNRSVFYWVKSHPQTTVGVIVIIIAGLAVKGLFF